MPTKLTPQEIEYIVKTLAKQGQLSDEYVYKLFPQLDEKKYDVGALANAGLPKLVYDGKRTKAQILAEATIAGGPLEVERYLGGAKEKDEWNNMIVQGDNLQFLKTCYRNEDPLIKDKVKGKVKLIYIDPPFATESDFGGKDGQHSYSDKKARAEFLESMRERLIYLRELLAEDGSIYIHLDQKMSHYVKIIMDEVFGKVGFKNEIVWRYRRMPAPSKNFQKMHDTILRYTKSNFPIFNQLFEPNSPSTLKAFGNKKIITTFKETGEKIVTATGDESQGTRMSDVWEISYIQGSASSERSDGSYYPTQKPETLIGRIISASSNEGDFVMDCFGGSGTTGAVAEKLGRRWIMCDFGKHAIYTMQKRLLRIAESKRLGEDAKNGDKYGASPKPFLVASVGAYDFSKVMNLREHKETYITFVLALHSLEHGGERIAKKYNLPNIYGEKDGNPVEVYPVWNDTYLKEIRIDEKYLKGIIDASGGKLRGDYFIIAPETCTIVGDTSLKNGTGGDAHFHILSFPYKLLEEMSRTVALEEQPASESNVNKLINSKAFYFNEDVDIAVERTSAGIKITRFDTKILDKNKRVFEGYTGLAMLLVDDQHIAGNPFDMDHTVYLDQVKDDGTIEIPDLKGPVAVIAIDKHGNESKPCIII